MTNFKHSGERGSVLPMIGLTMAVIIGFGAAAVDVGSLNYQWERQQNATDSAAIAAARQLLNGTCPASNQTLVQNAATADAGDNGFTGSGVTVVAQNPPVGGPYSVAGGESVTGANCSVAVTISVPNTAAYFLRWFNNTSGVPETTTAVAQMQNTNIGCVYLLNPATQSVFTGITFYAPSCGILMNDGGTFKGATVTVQQIGWAGTDNWVDGGNSTWPEAMPTPMLETQDPCAEIPDCYAMQQNPPSTQSCSAYTGTTPPANQCYSSISVTGNTTLSPGYYALTGSITVPTGSGYTINGSGVTFYVAAGASPPSFSLFAGGGSLTPPTSGTYAGVLYYQVPANTNAPSFGGTGPSVGGLIYAPGANLVNYSGTANQPAILVFGSANFNANITIPTPSPGAAGMVNQVVLVE